MDNYTGPYWSDGKMQPSVEFGKTKPVDALDRASRLHDSAYARFKEGSQQRRAADVIYEETVKGLGSVASAAGTAVLYGNQTINSAKNLAYGATTGGLFGFIYEGAKNAYSVHDWMLNDQKYLREVRDFYKSDPYMLEPGYQSPDIVQSNKISYSLPGVFVGDQALEMSDGLQPSRDAPRNAQQRSSSRFLPNTEGAIPYYGVYKRKRRRYRKYRLY